MRSFLTILFVLILSTSIFASENSGNTKHTDIGEPVIHKDPVTGMELVLVKGGCYQMGDIFGENTSSFDIPVHEVCLDDFYISKYETTVGQFRQFTKTTGYPTVAEAKDGCLFFPPDNISPPRLDPVLNWQNPGFSQEDTQPVVCVNYEDAVEFTKWLSSQTGKKYRLPTEAEWEYAARSRGKAEKWPGTNDPSKVVDYAWFNDNAGNTTHPVGQKKPNGIGLYDMCGNATEWNNDFLYDDLYYRESPKNNPKGPENGTYRAVRGGSWSYFLDLLRTTARAHKDPDWRYITLGFRCVMTD